MSIIRWFLVLAFALLLAVGVVAVAERTEIGPVLFSITPQHGVHVGDAVFALGTVLVFGLVARRIIRR